jgi:predicted DNA-binding transcriptional regulator
MKNSQCFKLFAKKCAVRCRVQMVVQRVFALTNHKLQILKNAVQINCISFGNDLYYGNWLISKDKKYRCSKLFANFSYDIRFVQMVVQRVFAVRRHKVQKQWIDVVIFWDWKWNVINIMLVGSYECIFSCSLKNLQKKVPSDALCKWWCNAF